AVGPGTAPAQCQNARVFGAATSSDSWVQVRTADKVLWTIGLGSLGNAAMVKTGDVVTFDLDYQRTNNFGPVSGGPPKASGHVQLSNAVGTALLWAGTTSSGSTWLSLTMGQPICDLPSKFDCVSTRFDVVATVNGSVATFAPFSADYLGGYYLAVGEYDLSMAINTDSGCFFDGPPPFAAAAVKAP